MRKLLVLMSLGAAALGVGAVSPRNVVPVPRSVAETKGEFVKPRQLTYFYDGPEAIVDSLMSKYAVKSPSVKKAAIRIHDGQGDAYRLEIEPKRITLRGSAFYGVQTLMQLLDQDSVIACGVVNDAPAFPYRGVHVDMSRHFRSVDFLKKQLDAMAMLKLNKMHLHLTDAAGWRMPIEAYPRLTSLAAWRPFETWKEWNAKGQHYGGEYGGFYTKDELRELVKYAADRHITLIPEIEMPGHSEEVVAAYPELGCANGGHDLCPGKEETFRFLEQVLDETMEIFPSDLIHIGGDEAGKAAWHDCPDCQCRMAQEGINDVEGLQSYLIHRIEEYVNSKGRNIIGWDEILEGGLAPNATVMSWRGTQGGIDAINAGHDVIMTPGEACYLDYTQDAPFREPESIGGYLPLRKAYAYEPLNGISSPEHLLGIQANLWSEYIPTAEHAEYMYYPRTLAIAEIAWSNPTKDYPDFLSRATVLNQNLKNRGYNVFDITHEYGERPESLEPVEHLARGAKVTYHTPWHRQYPAGGAETLTDGLRGGWTYQDKRWQGWLTPIDVIVDLGDVKPLHYVNATFMHSPGPWVWLPDEVVISTSTDGETFAVQGKIYTDVNPDTPGIGFKDFGTAVGVSARYVRLQATPRPIAGGWLFLDEIVVN